MNLDESQKEQVKAWIEAGAKLSEIQDRLSEQFNITMTYMDVRFLVDDLGASLKDAEEPKTEASADKAPKAPLREETVDADDLEVVPDGEGPSLSNVSVSVHQVALPGAIVSGDVKFSDGKSAEWQLDQMGRLGIVPPEEGYQPSQEDMMAFQTALQKELQKMGM